METKAGSSKLNRFTTLTVLLDMLVNALPTLVLFTMILTGCKTQPADSINARTSCTNMVVIISTNLTFVTSSNQIAITVTNPISINLTTAPVCLPEQPISFAITNVICVQVTNQMGSSFAPRVSDEQSTLYLPIGHLHCCLHWEIIIFIIGLVVFYLALEIDRRISEKCIIYTRSLRLLSIFMLLFSIWHFAFNPPTLLWSEILKNCLTSIALVIGGLWALYRFEYEARAHGPSLDGDLEIESTSLNKTDAPDLLVVSVKAKWVNRGKFALQLKPKKSGVHVFEVRGDKDIPDGNLDENKLKFLWNQPAFPECKEIVLEPKAKSIFRVHFILKKGPVYLFRWKLENSPEECWDKEIVWNSTG